MYGLFFLFFSFKKMPLDDLATTCNGIGGQDARHDPILSRGRPSPAKSEPTMQCDLLFSSLPYEMEMHISNLPS